MPPQPPKTTTTASSFQSRKAFALILVAVPALLSLLGERSALSVFEKNMQSSPKIAVGMENSASSHQFAIFQFDTRKLINSNDDDKEEEDPNHDDSDGKKSSTSTYWGVAAYWNWLYAMQHGHVYIYYTFDNHEADAVCTSPDGQYELASPWCKVKAMLQVQEDFPDVEYFLFLDSDAVVAHNFAHLSLSDMLTNLTQALLSTSSNSSETAMESWNMEERPMVFNQDGPCWWCNRVVKEKSNYTYCLNAGTVFWKRSPRATAVLEWWWQSSLDPYQDSDGRTLNPLEFEFRTKWPWEQDRQMAILHNDSDERSRYIQVSSQPDQMFQDKDRGHQEGRFCLSHLEETNCFVAHFCEDANRKAAMMQLYGDYAMVASQQLQTDVVDSEEEEQCFPIGYLSRNHVGPYQSAHFDKAPCALLQEGLSSPPPPASGV